MQILSNIIRFPYIESASPELIKNIIPHFLSVKLISAPVTKTRQPVFSRVIVEVAQEAVG